MAFNFFKKKTESTGGSDFSAIDSNEKAIEFYKQQQLEKLYLMPLKFGGEDIHLNVVYVPEFVKTFKEKFDFMIEGFLIEGKELNYSATPEYKGKSFIPSKLIIEVSGDVNLNETINIW